MQAQPRIAERGDQPLHVVGRGIVDDQHLELAEVLRDHRRQRLAQQRRTVVGGDSNGYQRWGHRVLQKGRAGLAPRRLWERYSCTGSYGRSGKRPAHSPALTALARRDRWRPRQASYTASVSRAARSQVRLRAVCRAAWPSARRRAGSSSRASSAWANAAGSRGGTSRPLTPGTITSAMPPVGVPTTGSPTAIASRNAMPNPSYRLGSTSSAQARISGTSSAGWLLGGPTVTAGRSSSGKLAKIASRGACAPATSRRALGIVSRTRANAALRSRMPLRKVHPPKNSTVGVSSGAGGASRNKASTPGGAIVTASARRQPCATMAAWSCRQDQAAIVAHGWRRSTPNHSRCRQL